MSKPLIVSVPHQLGREEAVRRLKEGLQWARTKYGSVVRIEQDDWVDSDLTFRVSALGQAANGVLKVSETDATVSVQLPWMLAKFAEKVQSLLGRQGTLLLDKKEQRPTP